jgi:hypothetical protein
MYEKPFTKLSGRPTKDKDPIISDWLEDAREHLVTIPDEKSRIDFLKPPKTTNWLTKIQISGS